MDGTTATIERRRVRLNRSPDLRHCAACAGHSITNVRQQLHKGERKTFVDFDCKKTLSVDVKKFLTENYIFISAEGREVTL